MKPDLFPAAVAALMLTPVCADAQSVWSLPHLENVRTQISRPMYSRAYDALISEADTILATAPLSVMQKTKDSPSGDNHDYTSLARYFHPDPSRPDGLPYVNRDGVTNLEISCYDRNNLGTMASRVTTLSLAWFFSHDERYARKAAELLRTWFLDPATRMNPNFEYAQMVPGINGNKGRSYGVLDGYSFIEMLDGVALLEGSKAWTRKDSDGLKKWMNRMLGWMLTSPQGIEESEAANNHSIAYDAEVVALALYVGKDDLARKILSEVPEKRIFTQINPDGTQPHEMGRTLSYHYSQYNLTHLIDLFLMAQKAGLNIDNATSADGRNFYKALDFLASYLGRHVGEWPGQQLSGWDMPSDGIPYWDMKAPGTERPDNADFPRDASAAALIASALYELADYVDSEKGERYATAADRILESLTKGYTNGLGEKQGFLLDHSTGHLPAGSEIDVPLVYADYYYLEALMRQRERASRNN